MKDTKEMLPYSRDAKGVLSLWIATASFVVAVAFSIAGFCVPPEGELHDSNLYLIAQFLLVTTSFFLAKAPSKFPKGENKSMGASKKDTDE